jgi:predicted metal-dependent hydrolase
MNDTEFDYRLRRSERARRVRLCVTMQHGLEVIIPARFNAARIPQMLQQKREWIRAALERARASRALVGYDMAWRVPARIEFAASGEVWNVTARISGARGVVVRERVPGVLELSGSVDDEAACRRALARWLVAHAQQYLCERLRRLNADIGFEHGDVRIKRQRTRWGSCSRDGVISLNARLMFQAPEVADYVLIHELCHLREMNHSKRFWALVARYDPQFRAHDRALRHGWTRVPYWA